MPLFTDAYLVYIKYISCIWTNDNEIGCSLEKLSVYVSMITCARNVHGLHLFCGIAANYTDMSAEVVEFKNIGCGQYLSNIAITVKLHCA